MLQIILAQNRQRAVEGLKLLFDNIKILENSKVQYEMTQINEYKNQIELSKEILNNENVSMPDIDDILTFVAVSNEEIMNKFN